MPALKQQKTNVLSLDGTHAALAFDSSDFSVRRAREECVAVHGGAVVIYQEVNPSTVLGSLCDDTNLLWSYMENNVHNVHLILYFSASPRT